MARLKRIERFVLATGALCAMGLAASASAAVAGAQLYDVSPVSPRSHGETEAVAQDADDPAPSLRASRRGGDAELARRTRARQAAVATILGRNTFCPDCVPPQATPPGDPTGVSVPIPAGPILAQLVATMEADRNGSSLATVYSPDTGTRVVGVGDLLEAGVVVTAIGPGQLRYGRGQGEGVLDINTPEPPRTPKKTPASEKKKKKKKETRPRPAGSDQIACARPGECTVERSLVEDTLANPSSLGGIRAFPSGAGFKIAGVRRGSLAHQLGLRSGDVLVEVNGRALDSVDAAFKLLPALRNATNFSVSLQRKGKPLTHNVQII